MLWTLWFIRTTLKSANYKWNPVKWLKFFFLFNNNHEFLVSHTTDDMIFQWDPDVPLVVDENIELPQLALVKNHTADCTQVYSTGWFYFILSSIHIQHFLRITGNFTCLEVVFQLKRRLGYYLFHTYVPTCLIVIMSVSKKFLKKYLILKLFSSGFRSGLNRKQLQPVSL